MIELVGSSCKDCIIFSDSIDSNALSIIYGFINHPMFADTRIRIMPDVHEGKDIVVGFTAPFSSHVNPDHIGGDIGCTVSTFITDLPANSEHYPDIEKRIRETVKFGLGFQDRLLFPIKEFYAHIRQRHSEARRVWPEYVSDIDLGENGFAKLLKRVDMDPYVFYRQISTVGGGNHFVEIGLSPDGCYAVTVHCGSRNFGQKVWKYWHTVASNPSQVNTTGYLEGDCMRGYITDMVIAQAYAEYNHLQIQRLVMQILTDLNGNKWHIVERIMTTHNYIDFEQRMIRKGAVASIQGKRLVIPFNMRDGLAVCTGKSNPEWNFSAPHGAGRLLSRSEAKALVDIDEYRTAMNGIYTTSVTPSTLDESPMAYKSPQEILSLIGDTVYVDFFIRPVINLKDRPE